MTGRCRRPWSTCRSWICWASARESPPLPRPTGSRRIRYRDGQNFRLAIDRAFTVAGSGTVVTGTVFNGEVKPGDRLVVSPLGAPVRVRAIQIRGQGAERAQAGDR